MLELFERLPQLLKYDGTQEGQQDDQLARQTAWCSRPIYRDFFFKREDSAVCARKLWTKPEVSVIIPE
jgi:hypothetical protein